MAIWYISVLTASGARDVVSCRLDRLGIAIGGLELSAAA